MDYDDIELYRCPKCQNLFISEYILWKDIKTGAWEPFCQKCKEIKLEKVELTK